MRNKIKKVLQRYGEHNSNLASEHLIEQLTDDKLAGEKIQGYKCGECGCGFPAKVFPLPIILGAY